MAPFTLQAKRYMEGHATLLSWYTHFVGIPLILFASMLFLNFFHFSVPKVFDITIAQIGVIGLIIYYFRLNWLLALIVTPILIFLLWLAYLLNGTGPNVLSLWILFITAVLGCGFQFVGHFIEGNKPHCFKHTMDTLAAPLFMTAKVFFIFGMMQNLKRSICDEKRKN